MFRHIITFIIIGNPGFLKDLETFYIKNPQDPYRAIWLYLAEAELNLKPILGTSVRLRNHLKFQFYSHVFVYLVYPTNEATKQQIYIVR